MADGETWTRLPSTMRRSCGFRLTFVLTSTGILFATWCSGSLMPSGDVSLRFPSMSGGDLILEVKFHGVFSNDREIPIMSSCDVPASFDVPIELSGCKWRFGPRNGSKSILWVGCLPMVLWRRDCSTTRISGCIGVELLRVQGCD